MLILPYRGVVPTIPGSAWLAEGCVVAGDVVLSDDVSVWFGTVIRGDVDRVRIGARTNVQDGCILHVSSGFPLEIGSAVTIGHGAILHGCTIRDGALIGIGARVLDGAEIGEEAWIGAAGLVPPGMKVPSGVLALGTPARVVRALSRDERARGRESAAHYVEYSRDYRGREPRGS
jgi:carbonic anhydrase/acetyltransferase-like protein (isoleucine patch superfamily)